MIGIRVALSSGDVFWLDCSLEEAEAEFNSALLQKNRLIEIGGRCVNPAHITQLTIEPVPSIESPVRLEVEA